MKWSKFFLFSLVLIGICKASATHPMGVDLGFRFKDGQCVNDRGEVGYNPSYFGNCGNLRGVILGNLDLSNMDLRGAQFQQAQLQVVKFNGTQLDSANFSGAVLIGINFDETKLQNAKFAQAEIKKVTFFEAEMKNVDFSGTQWSDSMMSYFSCEGCNFKSAQLSGAILDGSHLPHSNFAESILENVNFSSSDLTGAIFVKANLTGANLSKSQLTKANFQAARLKATNISQAAYAEAIFKDAVYNRRSVLPFDAEKAAEFGMILLKADCKPGVEVEYDDRCYHLDGSGGKCVEGYELAPQSLLAELGPKFIGVDYYSRVSENCCIWHRDIDTEMQDYGMNDRCNESGPFTIGPVLGGAGCTNANNRGDGQLTFCQSVQ